MALSNYSIPRTTIALGDGNEISVRGLNTEDISFLVQVHKADVDAVVAMMRGTIKDAKTPDEIAAAVTKQGDETLLLAVQHFPLLIGNIIANAADEPEAWDNATKLPAPVQLEALLAIVRHTFNDVDGFKKFVGNVTAVLRSVSQKPQAGTTPKSTGITA